VPTLFVGGAAPLADAETLPLQGGFDQLDLLRPVTKWAHRVTHPHRIPDLVAQALRTASTGRPGPVYLEIPIDVLFARIDESRPFFPRTVCPDAAPAPAPEAVERAIEMLRAAERPATRWWRRLVFRATAELVALPSGRGSRVRQPKPAV
jgi:acetolactate synthase-1/2/3 large subunit